MRKTEDKPPFIKAKEFQEKLSKLMSDYGVEIRVMTYEGIYFKSSSFTLEPDLCNGSFSAIAINSADIILTENK